MEDPTFKGLSVPTPTKMPSKSNFMPMLLIGGGIILLLIIIVVAMNMLGGNSGNDPQRLLFRLNNLSNTMDEGRKNIRSEGLSKINTEASLVISGDITAVESVILPKKSDKSLQAIQDEEDDLATVEKLKTAALNNQHDRTYKDVLIQKLENTYNLAGQVSKKSSSSKVKAALATLQEHLNTYYNQLKALP